MTEIEQSQSGLMNQFKMQLMKAWQPVPTINKTIIIFASLGTVFITIGILIQVYATHINQFYINYNDCSNTTCTYQLNITKTLYPPVFIFYELTNYYQNHRLYVASTNLQQLKGKNLSVSDIHKCTPIVRNIDLYTTLSINNQTLDPQGPANPCGLIAFSVFNDTYSITNSSGEIPVTSEGIAWPSDKELYKPSNPDQMWYNTSDERFMVWMRIAALPTFRKVWGRINSEVSQGVYTLSINNTYNVSQFRATKKFLLAESNEFGSKDVVMSIFYLTVGAACIVFTIIFGIVKFRRTREEEKEEEDSKKQSQGSENQNLDQSGNFSNQNEE